MSPSQPSSSTTTGSVRPSRAAVATSPQVIWKQPSPIRQTTSRLGAAILAAIAAGRPNPIDDQPLVIRKPRGPCAVHWLAIWWVCAPTSKASTPSSGRQARTASIAWCGAKPGTGGRSESWKHARWAASSAAVQSLSEPGAAARPASAAARSPTAWWARATVPSVSAGSRSMCSTGVAPTQASYSTSTVS